MKPVTTKYAHEPLDAGGNVAWPRHSWITYKFASLFVCLVLSTGCSSPDRDYEKAFQADDVPEYQLVLKKYPDHPRAKKASSRLGKLLWQTARLEPKIDVLKSLIRKYPQADFARDATLLLDDVSWEAAQAKNTIQSFTEYSTSFPTGKYITQARSGIEELTWQAAFASDSVKDLEDFIAEFPQSARTNEAEKRIKHLRKQEYIKIFEQDNVDKFKELDSENLRETIREAFWWPPLLLAADTRSEKIAAHLLQNGADANERGEDQATALHIAVRAGTLDVVKLLLDNKADINASIKPKMSSVSIGAGGSATYSTPPPSAKKGTPLHWAAYYGRPEVLAYLIQRGADVNADDGYGNMPIHFAAQSGSMEMIRVLIKAGADWKAKKKEKYGSPDATPLHYAKTVDVAEFFLKEGVAVDADSDLGQPIHSAARFGHTEVIEFLLNKGVRVDATCSWTVGALSRVRATPLWIAASRGTPDLIDFLVSKGGNIRYKANDGGSLLHAAAMNGNVPVIMHLVEKGLSFDERADFPHAMPMVRGWKDITPLGVAIHYGEIDAVKALLEAGTDVNARFGDDWYPLSVGFVGRNKAMVALLLDKDARLTFPFSDIDTRNTSDEVKELMKKHFSEDSTKGEEHQQ